MTSISNIFSTLEVFQKNYLETSATVCLGLALVHTFLAPYILKYSHKFEVDSVRKNLLHFLGELEIVFGFWSFVFLLFMAALVGSQKTVEYVGSVNYTEAAFVFVVMCIASTKPILQLAEFCIVKVSKLIPLSPGASFYLACLTLGSFMGSLITEPAAMTIVALLLKKKFFERSVSEKFKYYTVVCLFINISLGGALTTFAAPPVLLASQAWNWKIEFVFLNFGFKSIFSVFSLAVFGILAFRKELASAQFQNILQSSNSEFGNKVPLWLCFSHLVFLAIVVMFHSYAAFFFGVFLFFLGWCDATRKYQDGVKIRESLLVGFFLAGLITLGGLQGWWLQPLLGGLSGEQVYFGSAALSAVTDNAAVVFLGTQVPSLSDMQKYFLVAGAICAGGLTVIANAPNPAGYGILSDSFQNKTTNVVGISHVKLFVYAFLPTIFVLCVFRFF